MKYASLSVTLVVLALAPRAFAQDASLESPGPSPAIQPVAPAPAAAPVVAPIASPSGADQPQSSSRDLGTKRDFFKFTVGFRTAYVTDEGFDRFSARDFLVTGSVGVSRTLLSRDRLALAAGLSYDAGSRKESARDLSTNLGHARALVPIEGRYHLLPFLYGFARVAPGASHTSLSIEDPSAPSPMVLRRWAFATDLSVGASVLLGRHDRPERHVPRFWITPEAGYMFTSAFNLRFTPDERDDPRPTASTKLGTLAMNGGFFKVSADLSF